MGCGFCGGAGKLVTREGTDVNVEGARGGVGIIPAGRNALLPLPALIRELVIVVVVVVLGNWALRDEPMCGDDGRLCVDCGGAETEGT